MKDRNHLVIVGGNDAGLSAALAVRRCGDERKITVIEKNSYLGFAHCSFPYAAGSGEIQRQDYIHQDPDEFGSKYKIDFHMESEVYKLNTARRQVHYRNNSGEEKTISFDKLLVASGAEPIVPASFSAADELHVISKVEDIENLNRDLIKTDPVFIIGGGTIGVETAETLADRGYQVGLVEGRRLILPFSQAISEEVEEELVGKGVQVFKNQMVEDVKKVNNRYQIQTPDRNHTAGTVIAALGVKPVTGYLDDPSLNKDERGCLPVDNRMRTGVPGVYAAGDVILRHQFDGQREMWPVASAASLDGWTVGMDLAGRGVDRSRGVRRLGFSLFGTGFARMGTLPDNLPESAHWVEVTTGLNFLGERRRVRARVAVDTSNNLVLAGEIAAGANLAGFLLSPLGHFLQERAQVEKLAGLEAIYHPKLNAMNHPLAITARKYLQG